MSNLSINHSFYKPLQSSQPCVPSPKPPIVQQKKKDDIPSMGKIAIALALTALAVGGVYIAARGKGSKEAVKHMKEIIDDGEKFAIEETGRSTYYKDMHGKIRKHIFKNKDNSVEFVNKYSKDTGFLTEHKSFGPNRCEMYFDGSIYVDDVPLTANHKSILKYITYYDDKPSCVTTFWSGTSKIKTKIIYQDGKVQSYNKTNIDGTRRFSAYRMDVNDPLVAILPDGKGGVIRRTIKESARTLEIQS